MHTKCLLKNRELTGAVCKEKSRLVVRGNEEVDCQEEKFSPVAHFISWNSYYVLYSNRNEQPDASILRIGFQMEN